MMRVSYLCRINICHLSGIFSGKDPFGIAEPPNLSLSTFYFKAFIMKLEKEKKRRATLTLTPATAGPAFKGMRVFLYCVPASVSP